MQRLILWLGKLPLWHFVWMAIFLSELFTLASNSVISLILWGSISRQLLLIGLIDAFVVALLVAPILLFLIKRFGKMAELNQALAAEVREREQAEQAIKKSEAKYRALIETTDTGFVIVDPWGRVRDANQEYARLTGHALPTELLGRLVSEWTHPEDQERNQLEMQRCLAEGSVRNFEVRYQTPDGSALPVEVNATILDDQGGKLILALCRDITERKLAGQAVRESEQKYRLLADNVTDVIWVLDLETMHFSYVSPSVTRMRGYTVEEAMSLALDESITPASLDITANVLLEEMALESSGQADRGRTRTMEVENICKDGSTVWTEVTCSFIRGDDGLPVSVIGISRDITARLQAASSLRESEEKFAKLFRNGPVWMSLSTYDEGRYLDINDAYLLGTGWSREEVVGRTSRELGLWVDDNQRAQGLRMLEEQGSIREMPVLMRKKNGEQVNGVWSAERIDFGGTSCLVSVVNDLTERHRAEEALRLSEHRYRELFDSISDLICTHDLQGRLLTVNQTACQTVGVPAARLLGRNIQEFLPPQFRDAFEREYLASIKVHKHTQGVAKFLDMGGQTRYLEYRNRLIEEPGLEPFVIGSARDVSERILAEREMRRLEEQLLQSQKLEAVGVLAGGIAHDFNNVLQAISGYTQLVLAEDHNLPSTQERLQSIQRTIERAAGMIKQLMTLARKTESHRERVDLNQEVAQTVKILEHTLPRMIAIRTSLDPALKAIRGDAVQIEQVLLNLATNAGHAMPQGGELSFITRNASLTAEETRSLPGLHAGEYAVLEVADTGLGMDEDTKTHVFEPFFTTKPLGEGTGLGLSTVYGIVANHGGHIYCDSKPGRGTAFTIYFPGDDKAEPEPTLASAVAVRNLAGSETLLLVDDEPAILESCRQALEGFGYRVLSASSGEEALRLFLRDPRAVDLVVMDLNMPGMGGLPSMRAMLASWPTARILVATGYAEPGIEGSIKEMGGAGLIAKPYHFSSLLSTIRNVLDAS